jgi:membrane protease YdiL (CAAX protease family)
MFLERVYEGKSDIGRWLGMIVILIFISLFVGGIPLEVMIYLKMSDNPDLQPNPGNQLDLSAYEIPPITGFILMLIPFVLGLICLLLLIKPIHERPMLSVLTGNNSFRWNKLFWGAGVWFLLMTAYAVIATATGMQKIELQFNPSTLFLLAITSILLIPLQAGFEEVMFRGYLMQGFAKLFKYKWLPLLVTSLIFGALHYTNPEVKEYGAMIALPQYLWFGIFFGICVIMDEGLELAWGVHAMNNIFLSLFFTQDSSALQTPALYRITAFNPLFDLVAFFILSILFIFIAQQKYHWPGWDNLWIKINTPSVGEEDTADYPEDEYDEYDEK